MFTDVAAATIINLVLEAHGIPYIVSPVIGLGVMLELACGERIEAIKIIFRHTGEGSLKACMYAVRAVYAYMGKS